MKYENGKWNVTGDVLNPVEGFELLNYQGFRASVLFRI